MCSGLSIGNWLRRRVACEEGTGGAILGQGDRGERKVSGGRLVTTRLYNHPRDLPWEEIVGVAVEQYLEA